MFKVRLLLLFGHEVLPDPGIGDARIRRLGTRRPPSVFWHIMNIHPPI